MLKQIGTYMDEIILPMFNTSMTFEGTVANVRSTNDKTTGFDLTALASYAGRFGFALNNNILGGVTFSKATESLLPPMATPANFRATAPLSVSFPRTTTCKSSMAS
jgi:hypothetical protein